MKTLTFPKKKTNQNPNFSYKKTNQTSTFPRKKTNQTPTFSPPPSKKKWKFQLFLKKKSKPQLFLKRKQIKRQLSPPPPPKKKKWKLQVFLKKNIPKSLPTARTTRKNGWWRGAVAGGSEELFKSLCSEVKKSSEFTQFIIFQVKFLRLIQNPNFSQCSEQHGRASGGGGKWGGRGLGGYGGCQHPAGSHWHGGPYGEDDVEGGGIFSALVHNTEEFFILFHWS